VFIKLSFPVFIFILFFDPFSLDHLSFNSKLIFIAGIPVIYFLSLFIVHYLYLVFYQQLRKYFYEEASLNYVCAFLVLLLSVTAITFYLHYPGTVSITFLVILRIAIICFIPLVIWIEIAEIEEIKQMVIGLTNKNKALIKQVEENRSPEDEIVKLVSEKNTEILELKASDIITIGSADNYVEVIWFENQQIKKQLIRNTLRNMELQLKDSPDFIRCHRMHIVNIRNGEKLHKSFSSYFLKMRGIDSPVPVSRPYLLQIKDRI